MQWLLLLALAALLGASGPRAALASGAAGAPTPPLPTYDHVRSGFAAHAQLGNLSMITSWVERYVDPIGGSNANDGRTPATAVRTLSQAWRMVPAGTRTQAWRINIAEGFDDNDNIYMDEKYGSRAAPLLIRGAGEGRTVVRSLNFAQISFLYLQDLTVTDGGGSVVHFEACSWVYMKRVTVWGSRTGAQEDVKVNQVTGLYIEDCDFSQSSEETLDCVSAQYGHVVRTKMYSAGWCTNFKGGSAYFILDSNELWDCGESGLALGQGTGFEFMEWPWLNYEVYDFKVTNNVIRDVWGAAIGVHGGYNVLVAYNTLHNIGTRSHLLEVLFGERSCDGDDARCDERKALGGWGPARRADGTVFIPCKNVYFYNNLVLNSRGVVTQWQDLEVQGPMDGADGLPPTIRTDDNLRFVGNVFYNRKADTGAPPPVGVGAGCAPGHATCSEELILQQNRVNVGGAAANVQCLASPRTADYRVRRSKVSGLHSVTASTSVAAVPDFPAWSVPRLTLGEAPGGRTSNAVPRDKAGRSRGLADPPGAYAAGSAAADTAARRRRGSRRRLLDEGPEAAEETDARRLGRRLLAASDSLALMRQPQVLALGANGTNCSVAIIGTGLDYAGAAFGSCTAPGAPSTCKVRAALDIAPDDGKLDESNKRGTILAAAVSRVAPGAALIGLDVFSTNGPLVSAYDEDVVAALNWVKTNKAAYKICAAVLDLGQNSGAGDVYAAACTRGAIAKAIGSVRSAGVVVLSSTGRAGRTAALPVPACVAGVVSVASVFDGSTSGSAGCPEPPSPAADLAVCATNAASYMALWAPAYSTSHDAIAAGHAAGAAAVLASRTGAARASVETWLRASATRVTDARVYPRFGTRVARPRLDLLSAAVAAGFAPASAAASAASVPAGPLPADEPFDPTNGGDGQAPIDEPPPDDDPPPDDGGDGAGGGGGDGTGGDTPPPPSPGDDLLVTDLRVRKGSRDCPSGAGWRRVATSMDDGAAGGTPLWLCVRRAPAAEAKRFVASDLTAISAQPPGSRCPAPLKAVGGGDGRAAVRLCARKASASDGAPLRDLAIIPAPEACGEGFSKAPSDDAPLDLNQRGADGGGAVHLCKRV